MSDTVKKRRASPTPPPFMTLVCEGGPATPVWHSLKDRQVLAFWYVIGQFAGWNDAEDPAAQHLLVDVRELAYPEQDRELVCDLRTPYRVFRSAHAVVLWRAYVSAVALLPGATEITADGLKAGAAHLLTQPGYTTEPPFVWPVSSPLGPDDDGLVF